MQQGGGGSPSCERQTRPPRVAARPAEGQTTLSLTRNFCDENVFHAELDKSVQIRKNLQTSGSMLTLRLPDLELRDEVARWQRFPDQNCPRREVALEMRATKVRHSALESEGPDRPVGSCCSTEDPASCLEAYCFAG